MKGATCKGCGKRLTWVLGELGQRIPLDTSVPTYEMRKDMFDEVRATRSPAAVNHFSVCPRANDFNRKKTAAQIARSPVRAVE